MNSKTLKQIARYHFMGLSGKEIAKLLDLNPRTAQRYIKDSITAHPQIKLPPTRKQKALDYVAAGFSYSETAKRFKVSRTTVFKWVKSTRNTPATE